MTTMQNIFHQPNVGDPLGEAYVKPQSLHPSVANCEDLELPDPEKHVAPTNPACSIVNTLITPAKRSRDSTQTG